MSPRRRGRGRHGGGGVAAADSPQSAAELPVLIDGAVASADAESGSADGAGQDLVMRPPRVRPPVPAPRTPRPARPVRPVPPPRPAAPGDRAESASDAPDPDGGERRPACTLAQLRRFIKSRPYIPVHELRRRFLIEGIEDEVNPMSQGPGRLFVGLPPQEASYLGELVKSGEVGCELLLDPVSPAVVGVFPMRPVARQ
jgi:hypothetical protein